MHIGIVLPQPPTYSETFFRSKIRFLREAGFKVTIFTGYSKRKSEFDYIAGPAGLSLSKPWLFFLALGIVVRLMVTWPKRLFRLIKLNRKSGVGIAHSLKIIYFNSHILNKSLDWIHYGFGTMVLGREQLAKAIGAKMAVSFRGYDMNVYPVKNPGCYKRLWPAVDKIHSISDYLFEKAIDLGLPEFVPYSKITPAIDTRLFHNSNKSMVSKGHLKILTIGRLSWIKGLAYSIDAMAYLSKSGVDFEYSIIGDGDQYEQLIFHIHQVGLSNHIKLRGKLSKEETAELLKEADIYVQPSLNEGFCNAILEAQASKCLCIAANVGGLKENIVNDETGWLVPVRDAEALAEKIIEVNGLSIEKKYEITEKAANRVKNEFSLEIQKEQFIAFYNTEDEETTTYI